MIDFDIPAFLLRTPENEAAARAAWKGRKLTKPRPMAEPKKALDPGTRKLIAEIEAARIAKQKERLAMLKEKREADRAAGIKRPRRRRGTRKTRGR